jgi:formate dehydrogenase subunit gamma
MARSRASRDDTRTGSARRYLDRFSRAERTVHWITATLMIVCIVTAAVLYNGSLSIRVGHRHVVELIHVYAGL